MLPSRMLWILAKYCIEHSEVCSNYSHAAGSELGQQLHVRANVVPRGKCCPRSCKCIRILSIALKSTK